LVAQYVLGEPDLRSTTDSLTDVPNVGAWGVGHNDLFLNDDFLFNPGRDV
jgi:hypothetical protein